MNNSETAHCRLCASQKPFTKLVSLQTDEDRRRKIMEKLLRLSLEITDLSSSDDALPKTICLTCIESLDTAFDFVISVEMSQNKLKDFISDLNLKDENIIEEFFVPSDDDDSIVKEELDTNSDLEETNIAPVNVENTITPKKENKVKDDSPDRPLTPLTSTWKDYSWLCAYCDTMFPNINELKQHSMQFHNCCNPYRCTDCNIRKLNLDQFIKHVKRHKNHLKLSCYKCHMTFLRQYDTIQHVKSHIDTEFKCSGCNETFPTIKQSAEHSDKYNKDKRHRDIPKEHFTEDFTCVFCPKKFKDKQGLSQHLLIHTDRKRDHTCEKCGKCFLNKSTLKGHMMMHDEARPHGCEICKRRFRTVPQLRAHIGIHGGKKTFSCEQCGRSYRLKSQLNAHSIVHSDTLPYSCEYCKKGFRFKTTLNQHIRIHTGYRPYQCEVCQKDFTNWPNFNKHMKRRHDMNMAKRKSTPSGLLPINPVTGDVEIHQETDKTAEWKKKILNNSNQPGRPKRKSCTVKSNEFKNK